MGVSKRYKNAVSQLGRVCSDAGRDVQEVTLVAVSKTVGMREVAQAIEAGARDFGENRPDQLMEKADHFPDVNWHFIGNIQSRRIRDIVGRACLIHSLHKLQHAEKINQCAQEQGIVQDVLLEVNVSGEESKSGLTPIDVGPMLDACNSLENISVRGLMTMAPQGDEHAVRATFEGLAKLHGELRARMPRKQAEQFTELSMGMSEDWPIAVEFGATFVRIGRAIFSDEF